MSEYYGVSTPSSDFFMHYGIRGMRWGVRKYLDNSGKLTDKGLARYGKQPKKKSSPRKLQRDFNTLDKEYANLKSERADLKAKNEWPFRTDVTWEIHKLPREQKIKIYNDRMSGIEKLQSTILNNAKKNKYNVTITSKDRLGNSVRDLQNRSNDFRAVQSTINQAQNKEKWHKGRQVKIRRH